MTAGPPSITGKRERTKQANRAAILEAAREVFADIGFGAATVRDVVRGTDLATGTFYNYFPDKESVLVALLEESAGEARQRVRAARRQARTVDAFVRDGFRAYFEYLIEDLRAGVAAGLLPEHDVEYMAAAMVGAAVEIGARMLNSPAPDPERASAFVSQLFIAGLRQTR